MTLNKKAKNDITDYSADCIKENVPLINQLFTYIFVAIYIICMFLLFLRNSKTLFKPMFVFPTFKVDYIQLTAGLLVMRLSESAVSFSNKSKMLSANCILTDSSSSS